MTKARIFKDSELRKEELFTAAIELFLTEGFEETAVGDIVGTAAVALVGGLLYLHGWIRLEVIASFSNYKNKIVHYFLICFNID